MVATAVDGGGVRWSGLILASIGFAISRFTVASSVSMNDRLPEFVLTSALPMVLAFGLVLFGLVLTVSSVERASIRTIALWCVLGTVAMTLAAVVTAIDTRSLGAMDRLLGTTSGTFAVNTILGGAVGGTLIGIYAARADRRNRRILAQADRLHLLNRLLRDEVLNATTVILARSEFLDAGTDPADEHVTPLRRNAEHIQDVIDDVGKLTDETAPEDRVFERLSVSKLLRRCADTIETTHGEAEIEITGSTDAAVYADEQLGMVFDQLLSNSIEHAEKDHPWVGVVVETTADTVSVTISDEGPGIGDDERALLESGDLSRYDRPSEGFGLWIVRVLLDRYNGRASVTVDDGTDVRIELPRANGDDLRRSGSVAVPPGTLLAASASGLLAGIVMGVTLQALTNLLPVIGALYGTQTTAVGWITHLFHSVVFAVAFATGLSHPRLSALGERLDSTVATAVGFGALLWFVAAGVVMPIWLGFVGVTVPIPRLRLVPLLGHFLWGVVFATVFWTLQRVDRTELLERFGTT